MSLLDSIRSTKVRLRKTIFDRWIIVHPVLDDAAWSGSRWVGINEHGIPIGTAQVSNLETKTAANAYAIRCGFKVKDEKAADRG